MQCTAMFWTTYMYQLSWYIIPKEVIIDPFDGDKSVHSGRRGAQRDTPYRASAATHRMDGFGPPKAGFSRPLDCVMLHLWSVRPRREACLASKREKSVKRVNNYFLWYNSPLTFPGSPIEPTWTPAETSPPFSGQPTLAKPITPLSECWATPVA